MKKISFVFCLLLISFMNTKGQWYEKKYNVTDIDFLSGEQLAESLKDSKRNLLYSGIAAGIGGFLMYLPRLSPAEVDDNSPVVQQLIGNEGMDKITFGFGAGILAGGTIAGIVYIGRIGRIKSAIKRNYPYLGSLNISPGFVVNRNSNTIQPQFRITYKF